MENLKKQIQLLLVSGSPLIGIAGNSVPPTTGPGEVSLNPLNSATSSGLVQRQQDVIKMQDEMILEIGIGVDRLHGQVSMMFVIILLCMKLPKFLLLYVLLLHIGTSNW